MNTITRDDIRSINRQLAELRSYMELHDLINRQQAIEILNIKSNTLSDYISDGKVRVVSTNKAGQKFFSRKELLGL